jgi:hypothetical protein
MERFGDLELLLPLATGGMATVHVARHVGDAGFERLVAVKRVHRHLLGDPEVFAMSSDEARLSALVRHPNVVATHQVIDAGGELLLVQEYVEGVSLALLAKRAAAEGVEGRLPAEAAVRVVVDVLRALHAAHEAVDLRGEPLQLVHRDVSPQNVLVGADGGGRLIDFGIARAAGRLAETRTGLIKGKVAYLAPEQVAEGDVDRRADLWATGVMLHELVVGRRPIEAPTDTELMAKVMVGHADLAALEAVAPALVDPVRRALARVPDDRFATAESMADAIAAAMTPASDATMRALVQRLVGEDLAARRRDILEAMRQADTAASDIEASDTAVAPAAVASAAIDREQRAAAPRSRRWRAALVAIVIVTAAVAWAVVARDDGDGAGSMTGRPPRNLESLPDEVAVELPGDLTGRRPGDPDATTSDRETGSPATRTDEPADAMTGRPPRNPSAPVPRQPPPPRARTSTKPSASPSSELHGNPYGR